MIDELNPTPEVESLVDGGTDSDKKTEFNAETSDNVTQLRDYAKGLKTDLDTYKPSHEFIEKQFGNMSNAELASTFYGGFAGEEFDPDKFLETINQLSPQRAKQLVDKLSSAEAGKLAQGEIEKIFGSKPSEEEIKLFKKWKETGYGLGEGDDIPEAVKFNADGTPKSDEEILFLRDLHNQIKENKDKEAEKLTEDSQRKQYEQQTKIQKDVNDFSNERLSILANEFNLAGLKDLETDTAEARKEKEFSRGFIRNGIAGMFMENEGYLKDYNSAVSHIEQGEQLLARRYEPRIEAGLLNIFRSEPIQKMLKALNVVTPEPEERPEINESGSSTNTSKTDGKRVSVDDIIKDLVSQGKLKV